MPRIRYIKKRFGASTMAVIETAQQICEEYARQGFNLTLRQLYYQFVARGLLPNKHQEYKRLGNVVNDARLAGLIDWYFVEDRTRGVAEFAHWDSPEEIIRSAAKGYAIDKWAEQPFRVEVWIEKDALAGVIARICSRLDVPYLSCRGYTSQSEMWRAAQRMKQHLGTGQRPYVIHLGDHDPSGKDMSRDIVDRLQLFMGGVRFNRIALNMDQIEQYNPPPNPAKWTDSRAEAYVAEFGEESWELDALDPTVLSNLVEKAVLEVRDETLWDEALAREAEEREGLEVVSEKWEAIQLAIEEGRL